MIPSSPRRSPVYPGNGVVSAFAFDFKVFAAADVEVTVADLLGNTSALTLGANYTVTLNSDQDNFPGGTINTTVPLANGFRLVVTGKLAYQQSTQLPNGGSYNARVVEQALDKIVVQVQQLKEALDRTLRLSVAVDGASTALPAPLPLSVIGWDAAGTLLRNFTPGDIGVNVSYAQWQTQLFSGTGVQTAFVLTEDAGSQNNIDLRVNNVPQTPGVNFSYTQATRTITFLTGAPPNGTNNVVARYGQALPQGTFALADGSVSGTKLVDGAVTFPKVQNIATGRVLGRLSAGSGVIEELTATQVTASLVNDATETAPGRIEISTTAEAQGGIDNTRAITPARLKDAQIRLATAVATISGTAIDFTGIPSWAKRVKLMLNGVSTNGTSNPLIQLGDSGGIEATGYLGSGTVSSGSGTTNASYTTGFGFPSALATNVLHGTVVFDLVDASTNTWACSGVLGLSGIAATAVFGGTKAVSPGPLDRIRLTTVGGTDAFDAGNAAISWE